MRAQAHPMLEGVSAPRAAWLLARLRFRRQLNQLGALYRFRKATAQRSGTRGKSSGWVLTLLVTLAMLGNFTNLSYQSLVNMRKALGTAVVPNEARRGWLGVQMAPLTADPAQGGAA